MQVLQEPEAIGNRLEAIAQRTGGAEMSEAAHQVEAILERVRLEGDKALLDLTERFDGVRPDPLRIPAETLAEAWRTDRKSVV